MSKISSFLIRVGLASALFYPAINGLIEPEAWISFLPSFLSNFFPAQTTLLVFLIFQIILGLWILSGKKLQYSSLIIFFYFLAVFSMNLNFLETTFRDFPLILVSFALFLSSKK